MHTSRSTRCSVVLLLFAMSWPVPAFAAQGGFLFANLHWSPDGPTRHRCQKTFYVLGNP